MPKFTSQGRPTPSGVDLTVIQGEGQLVAQFAAYVDGTLMKPKGEMHLRLGVPFDQVPHVMALMQEIGGVLFEITVRRVPFDDLPEPGW